MKSDLYTAIAELAAERNMPKDVVVGAVEHALKTVYKKARNIEEDDNVRVHLHPDTGAITIVVDKEVVGDSDVEDPQHQMGVSEARRLDPENGAIGRIVTVDDTPKDFGRIAAQTAKQVVMQKIRESERERVYSEYRDRVGELINGVVQRADNKAVIVDLGKAEAVMPVREQVPAERYRTNQRLKVLLLEVNSSTDKGPQLIVSRAHPDVVKRLFEIEVPEIYSGAVEIKAIAREAGLRTKVAVTATQDNVDPVGSCVGVRGVRIQNIVTELYGEKIDVVEWNSDTATFITKALSPAKVLSVNLDDTDKIARVIVPTDQMSLAIGKEGQNARLAYKLTHWKIDVKDTEALKAGGEDLINKARAAALAELPDAFISLGRRPTMVLGDGSIILDDRTFRPLPDELIGRSVDIEQGQDRIEVFYERNLVAAFSMDGTPLSLTDVAPAAAPAMVGAIAPPTGSTAGQSRVVRDNGMFSFNGELYGPLAGSYIGGRVIARQEGDQVVVTDEAENQIATYAVVNG
ncbi:MAG TPA: transcription termination factor NusA [Thermomicrobiales bacterium]|jgi:N utilization substance protein A